MQLAVCGIREDSDQFAHPRALVRVVVSLYIVSLAAIDCLRGHQRLCKDCMGVSTDPNRCCLAMP